MSTVDPAQVAAFREKARQLVADWPPLTKAQRDLVRDAFAVANHKLDQRKGGKRDDLSDAA